MPRYRDARAKNDTKWKNEFGDKLQVILKEKKMTQVELSKKTKISSVLISYYCNARRIPNVRDAIKIALALEVDFEELFGFMDYAAWPSYLD